jgi:glyceraldehyde 3-phosphate dehydrogenase
MNERGASSETLEPIRVGINGFGRIGCSFLRANLEQGSPLDIVAINELAADSEQVARSLRFDSLNGRLNVPVAAAADSITVGEHSIQTFREKEPAKLPWGDLGIDIVIESTGAFTVPANAAEHFKGGARKVIISAPADGEGAATIVMGVNQHKYRSFADDIVSNASCTTNCLAPLAKVFDEEFGIERGTMLTVHAFTSDQKLHDAPHKDPRRARMASENMIPTTTGAAKAIGLVLPRLAGRLQGDALRVPIPVGSITYLTVQTEGARPDKATINAAYKQAAEGRLQGILEYSEDPLVSKDITHNPHSSIFDAGLTLAQDDMVRVAAWYDNEWGFSNRLVDLASFMGQQLVPA